MKLREKYNMELSLRAAIERRNLVVRTFVQPHNYKPEFTEIRIDTIPAGTPITGKHDQHF
jgi:hypothetical protein